MFKTITVAALGAVLLASTSLAQERKLPCGPMMAVVTALKDTHYPLVDSWQADKTIVLSVVVEKTGKDILILKTVKGKNHPTDSVTCIMDAGDVADVDKNGVNALALLAWKEKI